MDIERINSDRQKLSEEKLYLGAIRSLREDERFIRYLGGLKRRYDATVLQMDSVAPDDVILNADIRGVRKTYRYEIELIETSNERILVIDEQLALLNKETKKVRTNGKEARIGSVAPKEKK